MAEEFTKNPEKEARPSLFGALDAAIGALFERPKRQIDAQYDQPSITDLAGGHVRYDYPSGISLVSAPDASRVMSIPVCFNNKHCYEQLQIGRPDKPSLYTYDSPNESIEVPVSVKEALNVIKAFGTKAGTTIESLFDKADGSYSSSRIGHGITESKVVAPLRRTPNASYSDANLLLSAADNVIDVDLRPHRLKFGVLGSLSNPEKLMIGFLGKSHHVLEGERDENDNRLFSCLDNKFKLIQSNHGLSICITGIGKGGSSHQIDVPNNLKCLTYTVRT